MDLGCLKPKEKALRSLFYWVNPRKIRSEKSSLRFKMQSSLCFWKKLRWYVTITSEVDELNEEEIAHVGNLVIDDVVDFVGAN